MTFPVKPLVLCLLSIQQLYVQYQKMLPFAHFSMILLGLGSIMVQSIYAVEKAYPARKVTTPIPGTDLFPEYTTDIVCKLDFYCAYPPKWVREPENHKTCANTKSSIASALLWSNFVASTLGMISPSIIQQSIAIIRVLQQSMIIKVQNLQLALPIDTKECNEWCFLASLSAMQIGH